MMKRMTAREYARRHKLSLFQVIKKIQSGELKGEQIEENGLKVQYVHYDEAERSETDSGGMSSVGTVADPDAVVQELKRLGQEVRRLRIMVERCCGDKSLP